MAEEISAVRDTTAWNPGRDTVHADAPEGEPEVVAEPLFWGLFSLGGFITAFLLPVTLFLVFFAAPFGLWPTDPASYHTFSMLWQGPLVRLFFFVLIGGSLFHGMHRLKFMLGDGGFGRCRAERRRFARRALCDDLVHEVLLAHALADLHADLLPDVRARDVGVFDLQRVDRLLDVRRGSLDLHRIADRERVVRQLDCRDADLPVEVEDLAHFLAFHRDRG